MVCAAEGPLLAECTPRSCGSLVSNNARPNDEKCEDASCHDHIPVEDASQTSPGPVRSRYGAASNVHGDQYVRSLAAGTAMSKMGGGND